MARLLGRPLAHLEVCGRHHPLPRTMITKEGVTWEAALER